MPYECSVGSCGTCKIQLIEGALETAWAEAPGLSERDRARGRHLACQSRPQGDCLIKLRLAPETKPQIRPERRRAVLRAAHEITHDLREFVFEVEGPADFLPGQYALFDFPGVKGSRAFSMCNLPNGAGEWRFAVRRVPGGGASTWLFDQAAKSERAAEMDGPYGLAYLRPSARDVICIAGGSGLSPMLSIARGLATARAQGRLHFFYGGRTPRDMRIAPLIRALEGEGLAIAYHEAVSDAAAARAEGWQGPVGFIHMLVAEQLGGRLADHEIYFAGPPPMADAVQKMLMVEHKVPFGQIHFDRFF
jgi:toluene monooxygenase electron transfer component